MALPIINLSLVPVFPAKVFGAGPVTVTKAGLNYTLGWDITKFSPNLAPNAVQVQVLGYNGATGATERYPLSAIQSGLAITASQITDSTTPGRSVLTGDAAAGRTALGLGPLSTLNIGTGLTSSSGALLLNNSGATAGAYTNASVTVDQYGRVTAVSNGATAAGTAGQCRLVKSGANIVLQPVNGNQLTINGTNQTIPSAGVSLAPTGLTPSTLYYVYAYMVSTTMTLEASATTHATDTGTGVEIKSGDATRTLVGMVYPITGPAFADTATQRLVISWHNRRPIYGSGNFTTTRTTASTSYVEINSEIRVQFLTWASVPVATSVSGSFFNSTTQTCLSAIGIDGTTPEDIFNSMSGTDAASLGMTQVNTYSEGFHYATVLGFVSAGTGSWYVLSNAAGQRTVLKTTTQG